MISRHKDKVGVSSPAALPWLELLDYTKNLFILAFIDAMLDTLKKLLRYQASAHLPTQLSITIHVFGRPKLSKQLLSPKIVATRNAVVTVAFIPYSTVLAGFSSFSSYGSWKGNLEKFKTLDIL